MCSALPWHRDARHRWPCWQRFSLCFACLADDSIPKAQIPDLDAKVQNAGTVVVQAKQAKLARLSRWPLQGHAWALQC